MGRRMWIAIVGGLLAGLVVLTVALGAYRAGTRHDVVTRAVGDGQVVHVVGPGYGGWGPGPGFFLIPLFGILLVVLLVRGRRGPWGPGARYGYGPGWGCGPASREDALKEWHSRAHGEAASPASQPAPPSEVGTV